MNGTPQKKGHSSVGVITATVLVTLIIGGGAAYLLGYLRAPGMPAHQSQEQAQPKTTEAPKGKIMYWRSSMDPNEVYDKPGKDKMGMDLVPVYATAEAAGPPGTVTIDPATIQNIGVKTTTVRRKLLTREIRTVGRVAYDEEKVRQISPKFGGWVEKQYVNFPGQVVEKGEPLLEIYSPDLVSTQEEYLVALKAQKDLTKSPFPEVASSGNSLAASAERRLRLWDITEGQIAALRERGVITRTMVLHAPFKGIVVKKDVMEGGYVQAGANLYGIADLSTVWVYAEVYEYEAPWLRLGQEAVMTLAYQPGASYRGRVAYIYPYLKNMTRTLQVRMTFPNTASFSLKPDMWANVTLRSGVARRGLAVPIEAVIRTGTRDVAIVALGGGRFAPRALRLGPEAEGGEFEVLEGLKEGEQVVTSAEFLINSESNLQSAVSKMTGMKSESQAEERPPAAVGTMAEMPGMKQEKPEHQPAPSEKKPAMQGMPGM